MRYELPEDLSPFEERVIHAALDACFGANSPRPDPWALAGRAEALGLGALQIRNQSRRPWDELRLNHYTAFGVAPHAGRGDST